MKLSKVLMLLIVFFPAILLAQVTMDNNGKTPSSIKYEQGNQPNVSSFFKNFQREYSFSEDNQMEMLRVSTDKTGSHHRYDQYYKGVQIIGAQYILHEKGGSVWYANGHLVNGIDIDVTSSISEQAALSAALKEVGAQVYMWEKAENEAFLKKEQNKQSASFAPKGELILTSGNQELTAENLRLAYRFDVYAEQPLGRYWVDVDAKTGEIINKTSRIHTGDVPGSGDSYYDGNVSMTVDEVSAANFRLREATTRGAAINTYNMNNGTNYGAATDFTSTTADGPWDGVGVNGHWGAEATYDYYFNEHNRNSLDDAGFALNSYVHRGVNYNNAFWDGSRMTYGDGDGVNFTPLVSLDVVGHELTHGVTNFSSNLNYANESGGLNESFSDIFGNLVEFEMLGPPPGGGSWRIGEQITPNGLGIRNMANPNEFQNPDTYLGDYWFYNEVHNTSGVQNFWFYLLVEGGTGTNDVGFNYNVTGIGVSDAAAIAYHNNTSFLVSSSDYEDARMGSIACAESLFGVGSQQALSTAAAWDAVNVLAPPPPPDNDLCADAIALSCNETVSGTTVSSTFDASAPACDFAHTTGGIWYTIEGVGADITASMCDGPSYDARLTVYEGSCESLVCVGADDDGCAFAGTSTVTWPSTAGTTYYILVHGWGASEGAFELSMSCDVAPMISVTPPAFTFTVPLEGSASGIMTIANTGEAGAPDLNWTIMQSIPAPVNAMRHSTSIQEVNKQYNADNQQFKYIIGQQTIDDLTTQGFFNQYPIREQLLSIQGQEFSDKAEFYSAVSGVLGAQNINFVGLIAPYLEVNIGSSSDHNISHNSLSSEFTLPDSAPVLISELNEEAGARNMDGLISTTITHSTTQSVVQGSVACANGNLTTDNSYWRSFVLSDFGIVTDFDISDVEIGVEILEGAGGSQPLTINLYTTDAPFPNGTRTLIGTATYSVPDQALTLLSLPVAGTASAGSELVVEISSPDAGNRFWIGSNPDGQTAPSYISTDGCGVPDPTDLALLGFPDMHIVMNVSGSYEEPCPWLSFSPSSGTTAQGNSDDVSVMVDAAGLGYGTYECEMTINSNAGQVIVPVTLIVADLVPPVITVSDPIAMWPPNGKYENFDLSELVVSVEDDVDGTIPVSSVVITSASSDEPDDAPGNGDGKTVNDIVIAADCKTIDLRKERQGAGNGRVYEVHVSVADAAGNVGTATCIVTVPHDQAHAAVNDGPDHTVYSNCGVEPPTQASLVAGIGNSFENNYEVINYPNPFKGTATIQFTLEQSNYTKLVVYNSLGREVATLYDGMAEAEQVYKVEFNAIDLSGGVYFYHLQSGENVNVMKKMMLIK